MGSRSQYFPSPLLSAGIEIYSRAAKAEEGGGGGGVISKSLFSLDPYNLRQHCFFRVGSIVLLFVLLSSRPTM